MRSEQPNGLWKGVEGGTPKGDIFHQFALVTYLHKEVLAFGCTKAKSSHFQTEEGERSGWSSFNVSSDSG